MSVITGRARKTRFTRVLVLVILFSLFLLPLCAAEDAAPGHSVNGTSAPAAETTGGTAPAAGERNVTPTPTDTAADTPAKGDTSGAAGGEETPPSTEESFSIDPTILTVSSVVGNTEETTIVIVKKGTGTLTNHFQVVPLPLARADNLERIPVSAVHPGTPVLMEPPNGLTIPVTFTFNTSAPGEYTGKFVINSNASATMMPVQVKLKDGVWVPALILAIFTVFSVVFYDYATRGLKTDKLRVKIESIISRLSDEFPPATKEYTDFFYERICKPLAEATGKLEQGDYDGAEGYYTKAEAIWSHWILSRPQWAARLRTTVDIETRRGKIDTMVRGTWPSECSPDRIIPFVGYVKGKLSAVWEDAPGIDPLTSVLTTPEKTRTELETLQQRMTLFETCYNDIQNISKDPAAHACIGDLRKRLLDYAFGEDDEKIKAFLSAFDEERIKCQGKVSPKRSDQLVSPVILEFIARQRQKSEPRELTEEKLSGWQAFCRLIGDSWHGFCQWAGRRWTGIWQWVWRNIPVSPSQKIRLYDALHSVFLPAIILFMLGFTQLYGSNATFGANGVGDYFALVLWGFATGTASEPLAQMIKDRTPAPR